MEHPKNYLRLSQKPWVAPLTVLLMLLGSSRVWTQPAGEQMALSLRPNVVSIIAERRDGSKENGFGFIVGEREGQLLIVTANHVVRSEGPDGVSIRVTVKYFHDQGVTHEARLLETSDRNYDLAVLRATVPTGLQWNAGFLGAEASVKRGTEVWFIGRGRDWYVPTEPGRINSVTLDYRIKADLAAVRPGTSGAPLIADSGIIGMLVSDEGSGVAHAVPINIIRRAFAQWNLPWGLDRSRPPPPPPRDSEGMPVAILPWHLTGDADSYTSMVVDALVSVFDDTKSFTPRFSYYQLGMKYDAEPIRTEILGDAMIDKLWHQKSFFSGYEPNVDLISQLGKRLHARVILMYSLDVRERTSRFPANLTSSMTVFLIDVDTKKTYYASGNIEDFVRDRYTDVRRLTKKVFAEYDSDRTRR